MLLLDSLLVVGCDYAGGSGRWRWLEFTFLGQNLDISGSGLCLAGVFVVLMVVQLDSMRSENAFGRDPSEDEISLLPLNAA